MAKKVKPAAKPARYDWERIRKDYVEGWQNGGEGRHMPTLEELAEKYGVPGQTVRVQSMKGAWTDARNILTTKLQRVQDNKAATALALYAVRFDRRVLSVAEEIVEQIARGMLIYRPSDIGPPPLADGLVLQRYSAALKTAHEVAHASIGDTPGIEFEDLARDLRKRIPMYFIPKAPPDAHEDDDDKNEAAAA